MGLKFKNEASTTISEAMTSSQGFVRLTDESMFQNPAPSASGPYIATIVSDAGTEIIRVNGYPYLNTYTCLRAQEGTTAVAHPNGATIELRVTAGGLEELAEGSDNEKVLKSVNVGQYDHRRVDITTSDSAGIAELRVCGDTAGMQSTGQIFVGQSPTYGGGLDYNGDGSPYSVGAGSDKVTLFRMWNNVKYWTARNTASGNNWEFRGNVTAYASDERLKENIKVIEDPLDKVKKLRGVTYDWKDNVEELGFLPAEKSETGVIAQDVAAVIEDGVKPAPFDDDYLTVQHEKIIPLLIESIKELSAEVDRLKAKLEDKD